MPEEDGFTLVELLLAIVIMGLVLGAVASAFAVGLGATNDATNVELATQDAGFTSAYFNRDVQSAFTVAFASPPAQCGESTAPVLAMSWPVAGTTDQKVDYVYSSTDHSVTRWACGTGTSSSNIIASQVISTPSPAWSAGCALLRCVQLTLREQDGSTFVLRSSRRLS